MISLVSEPAIPGKEPLQIAQLAGSTMSHNILSLLSCWRTDVIECSYVEISSTNYFWDKSGQIYCIFDYFEWNSYDSNVLYLMK